MKAVLIDDEENSRVTLSYLIEKFIPNLELVGSAHSVSTGLEMIVKHKPDILFLDIELHEESGFSVLEAIGKINLQVIFITAFNNYALKAIKYSALDYLLKPVDIDELKDAVSKAEKKIKVTNQTQIENLLNNLRTRKPSRLSLSAADGISFVEIKDIIRFQADSNYTICFLEGGEKILVSKTLKEYEDLLLDNDFVRVHNSHIINLAKVKRYIRNEDCLIMDDGSKVEISSRKKAEVMVKLQSLFK